MKRPAFDPDAPQPPATRAAEIAQGLYPHQIEGVAFLLARRRSILADDMGLGKTRQSILALRERAGEGPFLVVCPASVKANWQREIELVLGSDSDTVIVGGRTAVPGADFSGWVIINYDILRRQLPRLAVLPFRGYVFDEAHYLKNYKSQRSQAARKLLADASGEPIVHCLTGTPMTNRPRDLFPLLQLVDHPLGRSFLSFAKRYCDAFRNEYGWVTDGASNLEELTVQLHGTMLRRRKDEVLSLPPKVRNWLRVEIPETPWRAEVRKLLLEMIKRRDMAHQQQAADEASAGIGLLARLAPARKKIAIAKTPRTIEFVQGAVDQGEKVVVYSCFTQPVEMIARRFGDAALQLTGKTANQSRQAIIDAFQNDPQVRVLAANIIAGGVGVNLTAARTVVFNDLDWVPSNHWQAEDRAYRIGQGSSVNVYYLSAAGTLDEFVSQVLEAKSRLVSAIVEGGVLAVEGAATADVLSELREIVTRLQPGLTETAGELDVDRLLSDAAKSVQAGSPEVETRHRSPTPHVALADAVQALARALRHRGSSRYRIAARGTGSEYLLEVDGTDISCSCRGFEYRGQCRHARELKQGLREGALPEGFREIGDDESSLH